MIIDIIDNIKAVERWLDAFEVEINPDLQLKLIAEEVDELLEVFLKYPVISVESCREFLKEASDVQFTTIGLALMVLRGGWDNTEEARRVISPISEMIRLFTTTSPGLDDLLQQAFVRVVESNMSKLGEDGKPIRREDGKVLKGPNYKEPDLTDLAEAMYKLIT